MAYLDPDRAGDTTALADQLSGAAGVASFPSAAAPANGVSLAEVLRSVWAGLMGTAAGENGIATFPAAAAPANNVSLAEVIAACYGLLVPTIVTGTTDIDDSVQTESTPYSILTIAPAAGAPLADVEVVFDLAKATTGFAAVESSATIQFAVARKVDGTNWRREAYVEAALSGTNAAGRAMRVNVGHVGVTEQVQVFIVMSADATADMELPYALSYKGIAAPTVTPVAAG